MTYEEAIETFRSAWHELGLRDKEINEAFTNAIESMEKQIPKKPNIIHVKYQRRYNDKYLCPVCGKSVDTDCGDPFLDYGLDWCNHCGQAIDWSNDKNDVPIKIFHAEPQFDFDGEVLKAVQSVGIEVDKDGLIEALEKQKPKKPKEYRDSCPHHRCPTCNGAIRLYCDDPYDKFCKFCGQAIDWSEE